MPSHPVGHVFLTLEWNGLGGASFEVHESQRVVRLRKIPARRRTPSLPWRSARVLNTRFSGRGLGRAAPIAWPPRSPDLTRLDFFLWVLVKDRMFVPLLPANVVELRTRITAAVADVTPEMLRSLWQEFDYKWGVCHITSGSHIEP
jgi:hypothetical protein